MCQIIGFPRIGKYRELKKALEAFCGGKSRQNELKKIVLNIMLGMILFQSLNAFDIKYAGWLEAFSKIGFNNQGIDETNGVYPTDSFVNVVGNIGIYGGILPKNTENHKLSYGLSIAAGSMIVDSTSINDPLGPNSANREYIGLWRGYDGNQAETLRLYVINNAYLDYTYGDFDTSAISFEFKGGRYLSSAEYMSGYTQGFEFATRLRISDSQSLKFWWFSSYGRAFADGMWLVDFSSPRGYTTSGGRFANYGIHAFKLTYEISRFDIIPFIYFSPGTYTAPALCFKYDTNRGFKKNGFRSQTMINFMNPIHNDRVVGKYRYGDPVQEYTQHLYIHQRFDINNYNFGLGLYKNFGNANAYIGTIGNPVLSVVDFWTATSYDLGRSISDMIGMDAITPYLFIGGVHLDDKLNWRLVGRYTDSTRSREGSIAANISYKFDKHLSFGAKLEWFNDITKAGYKVGANGSDTSGTSTSGTPRNVADRSHSYVWVHYDF